MWSSWYETPSLRGSGQCTCASGCWKMLILLYAQRLRWLTRWRLLCTTLTLSSCVIPRWFRGHCRPRHLRANRPPLLPLVSPRAPQNRPQLLPVTSLRSVTSADMKSTPENAARPKKLPAPAAERRAISPRKSATGTTLPAWLTSSGPVLLRKHAQSNKYSPLVERVHLLHANPQYAYVVLPGTRRSSRPLPRTLHGNYEPCTRGDTAHTKPYTDSSRHSHTRHLAHAYTRRLAHSRDH
ncbi:uncharacterized protein LOC132407339 [Hypanus sabinus]|uniref:uncharacterized protein LOC132407339 n=1 Tax=Hypanus sabinus TaxID=79690 RepID=UPI0028C4B4D0|nr:uncharacterized protein LOC132407339 [Hypanus sabinus]